MKEKFSKAISNFNVIFFIYFFVVLLVTIQSFFAGPQIFNDLPYTHYNNYIIFKQSFFHLINHKDLYVLYPAEHWDFYKYSPTFALLMAPLALLPDFFGIFFWNLINALFLFGAIKLLQGVTDRDKKYIFWFILIELITSLQNEQSNGLIAGLMIMSFALLERKNYFIATLLIVFSIYIKIFGAVALVLLWLYPNKIKSIAYTFLWSVLLLVLPLIVVSPHQLQFLYSSWSRLLAYDAAISYGLSVAGWLYTWFHLELPKMYLLLIGVALFCIPLLRFSLYKEFNFRLLLLSSVLLWIVIFNHKAESPTFIIAICGVALWYFPQIKKTGNLVLLILAFVFTALSPTDLFPPVIRDNIFGPYVVKALPCILVWLKLTFDISLFKSDNFKRTR